MNKILFILIVLPLWSCNPASNNSQEKNDIIVAKVGSKELRQSKIANLFKGDINEDEKNILIKGFVSNWIRDQLMIEEAEKNLPEDLNISELVNEYRSSLILNFYENKLVNELLDTLVSQDQKKEFYELSKNEFILTESIFKCWLVMVPKSSFDASIKKAFQQNNTDKISSWCKSNPSAFCLTPEKWMVYSDISNFIDSELLSEQSFLKKGVIKKNNEDFEYFVKVEDFIEKNNIPPLSYIDAKITQIILNNRKKALINRKKQQLYDQNYNSQRITINID